MPESKAAPAAALSDFHKNKTRGLVRFTMALLCVEKMLLHCCSTQLKGLTNVFCLKYYAEVILYMCICIVL